MHLCVSRCVFDVSVLMIALPSVKQSQFNLTVQSTENTAFFSIGFCVFDFCFKAIYI